jgi:arylsulfatase A-like enzyme
MRNPAVRAGLCAALLLLATLAGACARHPKPSELNLIFVLVDTLRADAVFRGGSSAPTLDRLAREGTVFTRAYAQASWTLPSVSSLLTGRWPCDSPGWAEATQGIPDEVTSLAQILKGTGRSTAAFISNPLITRDRGFGRGFDVWWASPTENAVFTPAAEPVGHAIAWLKARQHERFFALIHLMDPHDPYCPPARREGPISTWPGNPDPAFTGAAPMPEAATIRQWRQLYAEEVNYVDGQLSRLFASLDSGVRNRTVVVVTSDHGEEFLEHGFLKHGVTLFDEAVHVPLLIQVPGAPKGRRVSEIVRLVDVVPTLVDLLGVSASPALASRWAGTSLAGAVRGTGSVPPLLAMGETFGDGPLRWYVYDGRHREVLFNRDHRMPSEIPALPNPNAWLHANLPVEETYVSTLEDPVDRADPEDRERRLVRAHNLAAQYAAGKVGGLWLSFRGSGRGGRLEARVTVPGRSKAHFVPLFWRPADRVREEGDSLEISLADDGAARLAVLIGLNEEASGRASVKLKDPTIPVRHGAPDSEEPGVRIWFVREAAATRPEARNEMLFRLRALGYLN